MPDLQLTDREEQLIDALQGYLFLQYRHWPLDAETREIPFVKSKVVPLLPLIEAWHDHQLHADDRLPEGAVLRQATMEDRMRWMAGGPR